MLRIKYIACSMFASIAMLSAVSSVHADTDLSDLDGTNATGTITVGDLQFSNFAYGQDTSSVLDTDIAVYSFSIVYDGNTETGIAFQNSWYGSTSPQVSTISFTVTGLAGANIEDDYLSTSGFAYGAGGSWTVDEAATLPNPPGSPVTISELANYEIGTSGAPTGANTADMTFSAVPYLNITKTITQTGVTGFSYISTIDQGFSILPGRSAPTPLPASALGGSALLGLLAFAKMRGRRNAA
jgi:hypothetical protein